MACNHENKSGNYFEEWHCETPYCQVFEWHCLDCGVYVTECGCGYNNGMSGWSRHRRQSFRRKQAAIAKAKGE